jgi:PAS domain S-box-containing protein
MHVSIPAADPLPDRVVRFKRYARLLSALVAISGALVFLGWALDVPVLMSPLPPATMKANTAVGFVLFAAALWLSASERAPRVSMALAASVVLLAGMTASQDFFGWRFGIDELLIADRSLRGSIPGRMAVSTALCFVALGVALLACRSARTAWFAHALAIGVALVGAIVGLGYLYGVRAIAGPSPYTVIATHTGVLLIASALGVLFGHPSSGLMAALASGTIGGAMARRLLPVAILVPIGMGSIWLWGARRSLYTLEIGVSTLVVSMMIVLSIVIWWSAGDLVRTESERLRAERALQQREAHTASILETALDAVVSMDADGRITYWNRRAEAVFGWTSGEVLGRDLADIIMPVRFRDQHKSGLARFLRTGDGPILGRRIEMIGLRRAQTEFPVELSVVALPFDGSFTFNAFIADITERKETEHELRIREQHKSSLLRLSKKLEVAATPADVMDAALAEVRTVIGYRSIWAYLFADDGETASIIQASGDITARRDERAFDVLRVKGDRFLEELRDANDVVIIEDARTDPRTNKEIAERAGNRTIVTAPMILADLKIGLVGTGSMGDEGVKVPDRRQVDYFAAMVGHVALAIDRIRLLSDRARAVEETHALNTELNARVVERTTQLQAANKELEAFSYSVSHDLRGPLRHIDGFSKILLDEHSAGLDARGQRYLSLIRGGALTMGRMIDDLLQMARVDRRDISFTETDLDEIVAEVLDELRADLGDRAIEWEIEPLPVIVCDPGLVKLVFSNLLSNAVKYTRNKPRAHIRVAVEPGTNPPVIVVQDNGAGFDPRYADKLFGVFQRLHRVEEFEGTGIGLATVQRIVQKHGGRVWADAAVEKGATFSFTLSGAAAASDEASDTLK